MFSISNYCFFITILYYFYLVRIKGLEVHIYKCIGPGAQSEDIKWSEDE